MTMLARSAALAVLAFAAGSVPGPAAAQQAPAESAPAQQPPFAFVPVEGGALKLDTRTGKVSLCAKDAAGFACTAVPDSRDAYEAEIARLQAEIATLKGHAATPQAQTEPSDIDKAFDYAAHIYRRLKRMIDELSAPDPSETL